MTEFDVERRICPDHAAAEFLIRMTLSNPARSWVKSSDLEEPLGVDRMTAGRLIGELKDSTRSGVTLLDRRGRKRNTKWLFEVERGVQA